jgi:hypothetical protein
MTFFYQVLLDFTWYLDMVRRLRARVELIKEERNSILETKEIYHPSCFLAIPLAPRPFRGIEVY